MTWENIKENPLYQIFVHPLIALLLIVVFLVYSVFTLPMVVIDEWRRAKQAASEKWGNDE